MRTIKFRGYSQTFNSWFYGDLLITRQPATIVCEESGHEYEVEPNSVGQFTGLYDKNGKEIYEGDILAFENILNFKKVLQSHFVIKWEDYGNGMLGFTQFSPINNFVICGNLYENPELLTD